MSLFTRTTSFIMLRKQEIARPREEEKGLSSFLADMPDNLSLEAARWKKMKSFLPLEEIPKQ